MVRWAPECCGTAPITRAPRGARPPRRAMAQVHARRVAQLAALEIERLDQRWVVHPRVLDPGGVALGGVERLV